MVENIIQIKIGIAINVGASAKIKEKHRVCQKYYILNPATCSCKNNKYLASIIDSSVITCDKIIHSAKTFPTNFNRKMVTCKTRIYIFYLLFINYRIIIDSCYIYCYLTKNWAKQKDLLSYTSQITNSKKFFINKCIINMESNDQLK